jgi:hypothetical protein
MTDELSLSMATPFERLSHYLELADDAQRRANETKNLSIRYSYECMAAQWARLADEVRKELPTT